MSEIDDEEVADEPIGALIRAVVAEVREAGREVRERDTQYRRRGAVRAVFAAIEGFVAAMKQIALLNPEKFTADQLAMLREEAPALDRGRLVHKPQKLSIRHMLPFAFESYMKVHAATTALELDENWENFLNGIRIRDRITHPKSAEGFVVSDADLECIEAITGWLTEKTIEGMMEKVPKNSIVAIGVLLAAFLIFARKTPPRVGPPATGSDPPR